MKYPRYSKRKTARRLKPIRRRYRKRYTKSLSTTRSVGAARVTNATKKAPLGRMFKATLPYIDYNISLNPPGAGQMAQYFFSANGLYDPNFTGVGHQPLGFDQIMIMYDHYTVIASKITVTFINEDSTYKQFVGVRLSDQTGTTLDVTTVLENGMGKSTIVNSKGGNQDMVTLTLGCSPKKFFSKSLNDNQYKGDALSNPPDQVFFNVWCAPVAAVDSSSVTVNVRIDYIALFSEPKILNIS